MVRRGVFIPTQIFNFAVVPQHLRFVTVSVVALFWSTSSLCFLSSSLAVLLTVTNRRVPKLREREEAARDRGGACARPGS